MRISSERTWAILVMTATSLLAACHHKLSPQEKTARANLQNALLRHSFVEVETLARGVVQTSPNDNGAWDLLVQAECGQGHWEAAKQSLAQWRRAVRRPSAKLEEYSGDIALHENNSIEALHAWHQSLGAAPANLRVLAKVTRVEEQRAHWAEAETACSAQLKVKEDPDILVQRANCRRHLHYWSEALADLRRAEQLAPRDPHVLACAEIFGRLSKFLPRIRDLDAQLAVSPRDAALLADRSLLFLRAGDFELALEDSEQAGKDAPWAARPKLFAGFALLKMGKIAEAEKIGVRSSLKLETFAPDFLETLGRLDSEIAAERTNAELYAARAWQLNEIGQPALALQDAQSAAQLDPASASAAAEKGYALMKLGRRAEAIAEITHATALDSNYATAWQYRGELEMAEQNFPAAVESFSRTLALNKTADALEKREACYRRLGLSTKADEDHRAAAELATHTLQ